MTLILSLCDAVANRLNLRSKEGAFDLLFEAFRTFQPRFKLEELEESIKVCVVPTEVERNNFTRSMTEQISTIQVGVLARVELSNSGIDPLVELVDQIALDLDSWQIDQSSTVISAAIAPIFDQQLLRDHKQFTSIVTVTVKTYFE